MNLNPRDLWLYFEIRVSVVPVIGLREEEIQFLLSPSPIFLLCM